MDVIISNQVSFPLHGEQPMDLSVTQRLLHPVLDSAMLAPHPPFFLGPLTSQHCSQFSQQHLQVSPEPVSLDGYSGKLWLRKPFPVAVWIHRLNLQTRVIFLHLSLNFIFQSLHRRMISQQKWLRSRSGYCKQPIFSALDSEWWGFSHVVLHFYILTWIYIQIWGTVCLWL